MGHSHPANPATLCRSVSSVQHHPSNYLAQKLARSVPSSSPHILWCYEGIDWWLIDRFEGKRMGGEEVRWLWCGWDCNVLIQSIRFLIVFFNFWVLIFHFQWHKLTHFSVILRRTKVPKHWAGQCCPFTCEYRPNGIFTWLQKSQFLIIFKTIFVFRNGFARVGMHSGDDPGLRQTARNPSTGRI